MAAASMNFYSTLDAKLTNIPVVDGNLIFVRDKRKIYMDAKGERTEYSSVITLVTEAQRVAMVSPVEGIYFVKETNILWSYSTRWHKLTSAPETITIFVDSEKDLPEIGQNNVLYITDSSIYKWKGSEYLNLSNPIWGEF